MRVTTFVILFCALQYVSANLSSAKSAAFAYNVAHHGLRQHVINSTHRHVTEKSNIHSKHNQKIIKNLRIIIDEYGNKEVYEEDEIVDFVPETVQTSSSASASARSSSSSTRTKVRPSSSTASAAVSSNPEIIILGPGASSAVATAASVSGDGQRGDGPVGPRGYGSGVAAGAAAAAAAGQNRPGSNRRAPYGSEEIYGNEGPGYGLNRYGGPGSSIGSGASGASAATASSNPEIIILGPGASSAAATAASVSGDGQRGDGLVGPRGYESDVVAAAAAATAAGQNGLGSNGVAPYGSDEIYGDDGLGYGLNRYGGPGGLIGQGASGVAAGAAAAASDGQRGHGLVGPRGYGSGVAAGAAAAAAAGQNRPGSNRRAPYGLEEIYGNEGPGYGLNRYGGPGSSIGSGASGASAAAASSNQEIIILGPGASSAVATAASVSGDGQRGDGLVGPRGYESGVAAAAAATAAAGQNGLGSNGVAPYGSDEIYGDDGQEYGLNRYGGPGGLIGQGASGVAAGAAATASDGQRGDGLVGPRGYESGVAAGAAAAASDGQRGDGLVGPRVYESGVAAAAAAAAAAGQNGLGSNGVAPYGSDEIYGDDGQEYGLNRYGGPGGLIGQGASGVAAGAAAAASDGQRGHGLVGPRGYGSGVAAGAAAAAAAGQNRPGSNHRAPYGLEEIYGNEGPGYGLNRYGGPGSSIGSGASGASAATASSNPEIIILGPGASSAAATAASVSGDGQRGDGLVGPRGYESDVVAAAAAATAAGQNGLGSNGVAPYGSDEIYGDDGLGYGLNRYGGPGGLIGQGASGVAAGAAAAASDGQRGHGLVGPRGYGSGVAAGAAAAAAAGQNRPGSNRRAPYGLEEIYGNEGPGYGLNRYGGPGSSIGSGASGASAAAASSNQEIIILGPGASSAVATAASVSGDGQRGDGLVGPRGYESGVAAAAAATAAAGQNGLGSNGVAPYGSDEIYGDDGQEYGLNRYGGPGGLIGQGASGVAAGAAATASDGQRGDGLVGPRGYESGVAAGAAAAASDGQRGDGLVGPRVYESGVAAAAAAAAAAGQNGLGSNGVAPYGSDEIYGDDGQEYGLNRYGGPGGLIGQGASGVAAGAAAAASDGQRGHGLVGPRGYGSGVAAGAAAAAAAGQNRPGSNHRAPYGLEEIYGNEGPGYGLNRYGGPGSSIGSGASGASAATASSNPEIIILGPGASSAIATAASISGDGQRGDGLVGPRGYESGVATAAAGQNGLGSNGVAPYGSDEIYGDDGQEYGLNRYGGPGGLIGQGASGVAAGAAAAASDGQRGHGLVGPRGYGSGVVAGAAAAVAAGQNGPGSIRRAPYGSEEIYGNEGPGYGLNRYGGPGSSIGSGASGASAATASPNQEIIVLGPGPSSAVATAASVSGDGQRGDGLVGPRGYESGVATAAAAAAAAGQNGLGSNGVAPYGSDVIYGDDGQEYGLNRYGGPGGLIGQGASGVAAGAAAAASDGQRGHGLVGPRGYGSGVAAGAAAAAAAGQNRPGSDRRAPYGLEEIYGNEGPGYGLNRYGGPGSSIGSGATGASAATASSNPEIIILGPGASSAIATAASVSGDGQRGDGLVGPRGYESGVATAAAAAAAAGQNGLGSNGVAPYGSDEIYGDDGQEYGLNRYGGPGGLIGQGASGVAAGAAAAASDGQRGHGLVGPRGYGSGVAAGAAAAAAAGQNRPGSDRRAPYGLEEIYGNEGPGYGLNRYGGPGSSIGSGATGASAATASSNPEIIILGPGASSAIATAASVSGDGQRGDGLVGPRGYESGVAAAAAATAAAGQNGLGSNGVAPYGSDEIYGDDGQEYGLNRYGGPGGLIGQGASGVAAGAAAAASDGQRGDGLVGPRGYGSGVAAGAAAAAAAGQNRPGSNHRAPYGLEEIYGNEGPGYGLNRYGGPGSSIGSGASGASAATASSNPEIIILGSGASSAIATAASVSGDGQRGDGLVGPRGYESGVAAAAAATAAAGQNGLGSNGVAPYGSDEIYGDDGQEYGLNRYGGPGGLIGQGASGVAAGAAAAASDGQRGDGLVGPRGYESGVAAGAAAAATAGQNRPGSNRRAPYGLEEIYGNEGPGYGLNRYGGLGSSIGSGASGASAATASPNPEIIILGPGASSAIATAASVSGDGQRGDGLVGPRGYESGVAAAAAATAAAGQNGLGSNGVAPYGSDEIYGDDGQEYGLNRYGGPGGLIGQGASGVAAGAAAAASDGQRGDGLVGPRGYGSGVAAGAAAAAAAGQNRPGSNHRAPYGLEEIYGNEGPGYGLNRYGGPGSSIGSGASGASAATASSNPEIIILGSGASSAIATAASVSGDGQRGDGLVGPRGYESGVAAAAAATAAAGQNGLGSNGVAPYGSDEIYGDDGQEYGLNRYGGPGGLIGQGASGVAAGAAAAASDGQRGDGLVGPRGYESGVAAGAAAAATAGQNRPGSNRRAPYGLEEIYGNEGPGYGLNRYGGLGSSIGSGASGASAATASSNPEIIILGPGASSAIATAASVSGDGQRGDGLVGPRGYESGVAAAAAATAAAGQNGLGSNGVAPYGSDEIYGDDGQEYGLNRYGGPGGLIGQGASGVAAGAAAAASDGQRGDGLVGPRGYESGVAAAAAAAAAAGQNGLGSNGVAPYGLDEIYGDDGQEYGLNRYGGPGGLIGQGASGVAAGAAAAASDGQRGHGLVGPRGYGSGVAAGAAAAAAAGQNRPGSDRRAPYGLEEIYGNEGPGYGLNRYGGPGSSIGSGATGASAAAASSNPEIIILGPGASSAVATAASVSGDGQRGDGLVGPRGYESAVAAAAAATAAAGQNGLGSNGVAPYGSDEIFGDDGQEYGLNRYGGPGGLIGQGASGVAAGAAAAASDGQRGDGLVGPRGYESGVAAGAAAAASDGQRGDGLVGPRGYESGVAAAAAAAAAAGQNRPGSNRLAPYGSEEIYGNEGPGYGLNRYGGPGSSIGSGASGASAAAASSNPEIIILGPGASSAAATAASVSGDGQRRNEYGNNGLIYGTNGLGGPGSLYRAGPSGTSAAGATASSISNGPGGYEYGSDGSGNGPLGSGASDDDSGLGGYSVGGYNRPSSSGSRAQASAISQPSRPEIVEIIFESGEKSPTASAASVSSASAGPGYASGRINQDQVPVRGEYGPGSGLGGIYAPYGSEAGAAAVAVSGPQDYEGSYLPSGSAGYRGQGPEEDGTSASASSIASVGSAPTIIIIDEGSQQSSAAAASVATSPSAPRVPLRSRGPRICRLARRHLIVRVKKECPTC